MSASSQRSAEENSISDLSQNERVVLHSLIKWPDRTDQAIHSEIGMKKSTFSSIKSRLKEQDYYRRYYIPNFPILGFELLMTMFGNLNRYSTVEERIKIAGDTLKGFAEDFYVISESNKAFNLSITQNLTEYSKNQEEFLQLYATNNFLTREGMQTEPYPFQLSRVRAFMNYEAMIANLFGFASNPYQRELIIPTGKYKKVKLTKAEKKVLIGLVKYPDETDTYIADEMDVSRNTVANAKNKFEEEKICFQRVVPNLEKLGLKLMVFTYRKFSPNTTMAQREEAAELVREHLAPFFYVSKNLDGFLISAHTSFEEYNREMDEVMRYYLKNDYITEEPKTFHISIPNMTVIKDFEFLPLILKTLKMEEEYDF